MTFAEPVWLLVLLPLLALWWRWRSSTNLLRALRLALYLTIALAAAGLAIERQLRGGTLVVLADRSASMPPDSETRQLEAIAMLRDAAREHDRIHVVPFAANATVDRPLARGASTFLDQPDPDASSLGAALARALALIPAQEPGRILILSDGLATDHSSLAQAAVAAGRNNAPVAIDFRAFERQAELDVAIDRIEAPARVAPADSFPITAWVVSPQQQRLNYTLQRGDAIIARGEFDARPGPNRLIFRDRAQTPGSLLYTLTVLPPRDDPIPANNVARLIVGTRGTKPILVVTDTPGQGLASLLQRSGLDIHAAPPHDLDFSVESLAGFAGVVLENVPIQDIGFDAAHNIATLVQQRGLGLLMTGGTASFTAGGYHNSPIEDVLPVTLELRNEIRALDASIVVAIDRSGSMSMPVAGGMTKIQLAGIAAARTLELLNERDSFGAIAVDTQAHTITPLRPVNNKDATMRRLRSIRSEGGGIAVYPALFAAARMIRNANSATKHIILFADAADSTDPRQYVELLERLTATGVTVSVVALGKQSDHSVPLLREVAERGDGQILFTEDARLLPELFVQETARVLRAAFLPQRTDVMTLATLGATFDLDLPNLPPIGGYNPARLRTGANAAALTLDQFNAPLIASWRAGLGRSAAYLGEADGQHSGPIAQWPHVGQLFATLARWTVTQDAALPDGAVVQQRLQAGSLRIDLYLDPQQPPPTQDPILRLLRARPGDDAHAADINLQLTAPDRFTAEIPLEGDDVVVPTLLLGDAVAPLAPTRLPYSPEYRPPTGIVGRPLLERLAARTAGVERTAIAQIFDDMPNITRVTPLAPLLFIVAATLLLAEVAERRTAAITSAAHALRNALNLLKPNTPTAASQPQTPRLPAIARTLQRPLRLITTTAAQNPRADAHHSNAPATQNPRPDAPRNNAPAESAAHAKAKRDDLRAARAFDRAAQQHPASHPNRPTDHQTPPTDKQTPDRDPNTDQPQHPNQPTPNGILSALSDLRKR